MPIVNFRIFNYKKLLFYGGILFILAAIFILGVWVGSVKFAYHVPQPGNVDFSLFWDAYGKLKNNFINPEKIDSQKILYGAISGMANSLGDPYTEFFNPEKAKKFQQDLSGSFSGIGVEIGIKKDTLVVIAPLKGSPGERAGLKPGDYILKINNNNASNITIDEAVSLIRGPKGTDVTLNIFREEWNSSKDITITREIIKIPSVDLSFKGENNSVAYLQIYNFDQGLQDNFKAKATEILQSDAKSIVLDLRGNPGGYLDVAQNIAGWFLKPGELVVIEDSVKTAQKKEFRANGNASLSNYPMVVLINEGSASASEILAGALRENRKIKLIGTKSFGKGSVQEIIDLIDGSFLKITVAHWLTPNGNLISEVGLAPDIKIEINENDVKEKKDPQLEKALEIVQTLK